MGRRWGQHFLRSQGVIDKIVEAANLGANDLVLEIGPGEGVVTTGLCQRSGNVHAFEIDPELAAKLRAREVPNLSLHEGDFLRQDLRPLAQLGGPWTVVANLPYYITAPILDRLFWERHLPIRHAVLMMQDEVAQRIQNPASREAGALTYIVGAFHRVEYLFKVPPGCFAPPPKVESAVVRVTPHSAAGPESEGFARTYERLVSVAFGQRRKQLGRSLRSLSTEAPVVLERAGIDPARRPETLSVEEFWSLARTWPNSV
jgi:16S rRNA (adenine1518-N6/adenine1519-N6)-dimethyltransferase